MTISTSDLFNLHILLIRNNCLWSILYYFVEKSEQGTRVCSMDRKSSRTLCCEHSIRRSRETGGHDYKPLDVFARFVSSTVVPRYFTRHRKFRRCVRALPVHTFVSRGSDSTVGECTRDEYSSKDKYSYPGRQRRRRRRRHELESTPTNAFFFVSSDNDN